MDGNLPLNSGKQRKQGRAGQVEGKDTLPALKQMLQLMEIRNVLRPITHASLPHHMTLL